MCCRLIVSVLNSRLNGLDSIPGWVIVLGSISATILSPVFVLPWTEAGNRADHVVCPWARHFTLVPFHPRVLWAQMNSKINVTWRNSWGINLYMYCDGLASHSGGVAITPVASYYRNWDALSMASALLWATKYPGVSARGPNPYSFIYHFWLKR